MKKKNINKLYEQKKHRKALKSAARRKEFKKIKEQWKLGIGLYETSS